MVDSDKIKTPRRIEQLKMRLKDHCFNHHSWLTRGTNNLKTLIEAYTIYWQKHTADLFLLNQQFKKNVSLIKKKNYLSFTVCIYEEGR